MLSKWVGGDWIQREPGGSQGRGATPLPRVKYPAKARRFVRHPLRGQPREGFFWVGLGVLLHRNQRPPPPPLFRRAPVGTGPAKKSAQTHARQNPFYLGGRRAVLDVFCRNPEKSRKNTDFSIFGPAIRAPNKSVVREGSHHLRPRIPTARCVHESPPGHAD